MKKLLLCVSAIALLAGCEMNVQSVGETSTAEIEIAGGRGHGSGVYLGNHEFLTAGHVVTAGPITGLSFAGGYTITETPEVVWVDTTYDLAVVRFPYVSNLRPRTLLCEPVKTGDIAFIEGYPFDIGRVLTKGIVAGPHLDFTGIGGPWKEGQVLDVTAGPGNSGGPVFNLAGDVIGTLVGGIPGFGWSFMVPSTVACKLQAEHGNS